MSSTIELLNYYLAEFGISNKQSGHECDIQLM
jgi:hypothetical protein